MSLMSIFTSNEASCVTNDDPNDAKHFMEVNFMIKWFTMKSCQQNFE